jgi:uncharacterized membrane protein HdeD (DUF308 family)
MSVAAHATRSSDLTERLRPAGRVRGLAALALGAFVLFGPVASPMALARVVCLYWIVDGALALWASRFVATRGTNRALLAARGVTGIGAAVVLLSLPLGELFAPWRPGQIILVIFSVAPALTVIGLQIGMAATIDVLIGLQVRHRVPGEWSILLGAGVSIALTALLAACFVGPSAAPARLLGVAGVAGGLGLLAGTRRLRPARHGVPARR